MSFIRAAMADVYRYRFGQVVFDAARLELMVSGLPVDIQPKPLWILALLLERGGEVVRREELLERVWEGRPTVENVVATAISRLRAALGPDGPELIQNIPRVGYRFAGPISRTLVSRAYSSPLALASDMPVPLRPEWFLDTQLGQSQGREVWLTRAHSAGARRVYKFASHPESLAGLRREAALSRILTSQLGPRDDLCPIVDWNFESDFCFIGTAYGGEDLLYWSRVPGEGRLGL